MRKFPKAKTFEDNLLFVFGLFGTMPVLELFGYTVFTWLTLMTVGYILLREYQKSTLRMTGNILPYFIFTVLTILSAVICLFSDMPEMWRSIQPTNIVWQILYLILFMYYCNEDRLSHAMFYIKGVYIASIVHAVWGVLQFAVYETMGVALNTWLFYDIMHIESSARFSMRHESIMVCGLCWNGGHLAPLLAIGYVFSESPYLKFFFFLIGALSTSRTALICITVCAVLEIGVRLYNLQRKRIKPFNLLALIFVPAILVLFMLFSSGLAQSVSERAQTVMGLIDSETLQNQGSAQAHTRYWTSISEVTGWNALVNNLFGYGIGASGYPFASLFGQYTDFTWVVECDYINNLWSFGYIGFIVWYAWYLSKIIKAWTVDRRLVILFISLLVGGVTYNVTFNWCLVFLLFIFIHMSYGRQILGNYTTEAEELCEDASV